MRDLLESIIHPSKSIAEGYALTEIKTTSGETVTGRIEREDESLISIRPLVANEEVVAIRKTEINQRTVSNVSNMPPGMLNTLDESQVFDLLAYLISDGEPAQPAFHSPAAAVPEAK